MKKIQILVPLVCAFGLLVSGCKKDEAPAPGGAAPAKSFDLGAAAANTLETTGKKLKFATVMYDARTPNLITPCYFVPKQVRDQALKKDNWVVDYSITYTSGGRQVTKTATFRVGQSENHVHDDPEHEEDGVPEGKKRLISLADHIDVGLLVPDQGSTFTGTANLLKDADGTRAVVETASLPTTHTH